MFANGVTLKRYLSRRNRLNLIILLVDCMLCGICESAKSDYLHYENNVTTSVLRFHDFEPRTVVVNLEPRLVRPNKNLNFKRLARGIHFYSTPDDVTMEMEFIVPFFKIPIERSTELSQIFLGNLANLNTGTLISTGVIVAIGAAVAGIVKLLTTPHYVYESGKKKTSRSDNPNAENFFSLLGKQSAYEKLNQDEGVLNFKNFIDLVELKLKSNDIDASVCMQNLICHSFSAKATSSSVTSNSMQQIIDGIINLDASRTFLKGTAIEQSLAAANKGRHSCDHIFRKCKWPKIKTNTIINYLKLIIG